MRIQTDRIPPEGLALETSYDPMLLEVDSVDTRCVAPVMASFRVSKCNHEITVHGALDLTLALTCARCLTEVMQDVHKDVTLYHTETEDGELDLTPEIREAIIFEFPLRPLCRPDCPGLCSVCGRSQNEGACNHVTPKTSSFPLPAE